MAMKVFKKMAVKFFLINLVAFSAVYPKIVQAGVSLDPTSLGGIMSTFVDVSLLVDEVINWFLSLTSIIAILFLIIGGIYYITSFGDDTKMKEAKKIITYAIYGLVLVLISYSVVTTVNYIICGGAC